MSGCHVSSGLSIDAMSAFNTECEIVGVVGHAKQFGLTEGGKDGEPQLYYASMQVPDKFVSSDTRK